MLSRSRSINTQKDAVLLNIRGRPWRVNLSGKNEKIIFGG